MKKFIVVLMVLGVTIFLTSCQQTPDTTIGATMPMAKNGNSLYHQTEEVSLKVGELAIAGEVAEPGIVNLEDFYKREVMIREALYDSEEIIDFVGVYRYRGYSLFDLLHPYNYQKKNSESFPPSIDLYIVIENVDGEEVVFSWSEIFHTPTPHQVLIATEMAPIIPRKKEVNYPFGDTWKLVSGNDLFAYRMLVNPVKITVMSFDEKEYEIEKGMSPMYSPKIAVVTQDGDHFEIDRITDTKLYRKYYHTFYGMGQGYHHTKYFSGPELSALLDGKINLFDPEKMQHGLVCFVGLDGYRAMFSFSELFNRNDQAQPILVVPEKPEENGFYWVFMPTEFYADRSVKALQEIYFFEK